VPSMRTFNILVDTLCKEGMLIDAKKVFDMMIQQGIEPDVVSYNSLIGGYCLQNKLKDAIKALNMLRGVVHLLLLAITH